MNSPKVIDMSSETQSPAGRSKNDPFVPLAYPAPMLSSPNAFRLEHLIHSGPSVVTPRRAVVRPGMLAPELALDGTDGTRLVLSELRGTRVLLRLTRAVSATII